jgi:hypothetical protein
MVLVTKIQDAVRILECDDKKDKALKCVPTPHTHTRPLTVNVLSIVV